MKQLTILSGLPASGKSTYAKKLVNKNPETTIIVCRDKIREALGKYWVPSREKLVTDIEHRMIRTGLELDYHVVVDATNLNKKYLESIEKIGKSFAISDGIITNYKRFDTPLWLCVFRDFKRGLFGGRRVGYKVIKSFYDRYYKNTKS